MTHQEDEWKSAVWAPKHAGGGWSLLTRTAERSFQSPAELLRVLGNWQPVNATLAASPESSHFVPPICLAELEGKLTASYLRQAKVALAVTAFFVVFTLYLALTRQTLRTIEIFAVSLLSVVAIGLDSMALARDPVALEERAKFMGWIQRSRVGRRASILWLSFLVSIALLQFALQSHYGGLEPLVRAVGADFASIRSGEYWRYLTGPVFHSGAAHFLNNALFLMFIGTVSWAMLRYESLLAFVLGNIAGACAQMAFGSPAFDSFLGVSPGVFALFGCVMASGIAERSRWPSGFPLLCFWVALASLLMGEILSSRAATVSHFTGLLFGVALGLATVLVRRMRRGAGAT